MKRDTEKAVYGELPDRYIPDSKPDQNADQPLYSTFEQDDESSAECHCTPQMPTENCVPVYVGPDDILYLIDGIDGMRKSDYQPFVSFANGQHSDMAKHLPALPEPIKPMICPDDGQGFPPEAMDGVSRRWSLTRTEERRRQEMTQFRDSFTRASVLKEPVSLLSGKDQLPGYHHSPAVTRPGNEKRRREVPIISGSAYQGTGFRESLSMRGGRDQIPYFCYPPAVPRPGDEQHRSDPTVYRDLRALEAGLKESLLSRAEKGQLSVECPPPAVSGLQEAVGIVFRGFMITNVVLNAVQLLLEGELWLTN
ncbi:unnamed protein product [Echinostoma caproni]|uniref:AXIN2 n=1 Tax=Echinostoma caproni TaxID=27848 RepID=A0A183APQ7_9TREM|nr:unnamed protein product [Echinostoma caproni]